MRRMFSCLSFLECAACPRRYDCDEVHGLCECGAPLLCRYDLEQVRRLLTQDELQSRVSALWRYHELLPVQQSTNVVSVGEGMSPLVALRELGERTGVPRLTMKDESPLPTGTFKARGAAVGLSRALELGIHAIAMPTNGNAGAAWAAYAARGKVKALMVMPALAPPVPQVECAAYGAELWLTNGLIGDAGAAVRAAVTLGKGALLDASTFKEPYRLEGKKTIGFEIAEDFGWQLPNVIICPTGGGMGLVGIYKAFLELRELGWLLGDLPRLVAVQSAGCAPIVRSFQAHAHTAKAWEGPGTVAFGIMVPDTLADFMILDALYATEGCAVAVEDDEVVTSLKDCARLEGMFVCPEGAAALSAVRRLREANWLREEDDVVVLNTGSGLKYLDLIDAHPPVLAVGQRIPIPISCQSVANK